MTSTSRLISLDAFRGFTIASMLLVNNPGDWNHLYAPLEHAAWNGWTFTDLIFPFFLFIGGLAMSLSLAHARQRGMTAHALRNKLFVRGLLIIVIGLLLNLFPTFDWAHLRIPGVLQRIGLCVLLCAPLAVHGSARAQGGAILLIFMLYSAVQLGVPVYDPAGLRVQGVLEPGRDAGAALDRLLLSGHLWAHSRVWDPEGLLSTFPAATSLLFGLLFGRLLRSAHPAAERTVWMLFSGLALLALGNALDILNMPINKNLWTPAYACLSAGWAALLFSAFYWLLDAQPAAAARLLRIRLCQPLVVFGMNALFLFVLSNLLVKSAMYLHLNTADGQQRSLAQLAYGAVQRLPLAPVNTSLLHAVLFVSMMYVLAHLLWRRGWFVKI